MPEIDVPELAAAHQAIAEDRFDDARAAIEALAQARGAGDLGVLHLQGLLAWAKGDLREAATRLLDAADHDDASATLRLDCAELYLASGLDLDVPETLLRGLLAREGLADEAADAARLMLAEARLQHGDPDGEEALELLDAITEAGRADPMWRSVRAAALLEEGRAEDAVAELREALGGPEGGEDADLHYQLGMCLAVAGQDEEAVAAMQRVVELDAAVEAYDPMDEDEAAGLRAAFEEVLEGLPDPLLRRVASAPVALRLRPDAAAIAAGIDPRAFLGFIGSPAAGDPERARLEGIAIYRDVLLDALDDEDELPEAFVTGLVDEFRRFFEVEDLVAAQA